MIWQLFYLSSSSLHAYSTLQAKVEYEIGIAKKIILAKNEELHATEEGLSGLKEITPSDEFKTGGFVKQNLTSHVGPATLDVGKDLVPKFQNRKSWKTVFGPVFIYLNSVLDGEDQRLLWEDTKVQVCVSKLLMLKINIDNASEDLKLDVLVYEPPRDNPTLWEIGIKKHMVNTRIYRFRQYGLWERYAELYPDDDFIFKIGINDYHKDWLFAQGIEGVEKIRQNKQLIETLSKPSSDTKDLSFPAKYSKSFLNQFLASLWKQNLSYWRNLQYTVVRFFYIVIISYMFGTIA
ncbi:hypothetical protein GIB67_030345 [Kingdonia uniflora]|uniref:Uncharacterized protein n=1 Tax=Kingdonia uniflora TaxID=39325 RepID=A0A7J7M6Z8_9MAGN|nr:hypothetical protein GIB67_030345 [Kingdonia uniflora]